LFRRGVTLNGHRHRIAPTTSGEAHEQICDKAFDTGHVCDGALVLVPMVTPARAAADSKQMKKNSNKKKTLNSPSAYDPWSPNHANEDPDRKAAGGGY
jgi:hypothetical protein